MKFTIAGLGKKELNKFNFIANARTPVPILANLLLEAKDNTLTITACNLETLVVESFECDIITPGKITVDAKRFIDIIDKFDNTPVLIENDKRLTVSQGSTKFELATRNADDYPDLTFGNATEFEVNKYDFLDAIKKTVYATSSDNSRFNLNCICIDENHFVATDGHRLSIIDMPSSINKKVMLPSQFCYTILKSFNGTGVFTFGLEEKWAFVSENNVKISTRLQDGDYPDYTRVISSEHTNTATIDKKEFLQSIKRIALIATQHDMGVEISVSETQVTINKRSDIGAGEDCIPCTSDGGFAFICNIKYLTECLNNIDTESVTMKYLKDGAPIVFVAENNTKHISLVMPMRK